MIPLTTEDLFALRRKTPGHSRYRRCAAPPEAISGSLYSQGANPPGRGRVPADFPGGPIGCAAGEHVGSAAIGPRSLVELLRAASAYPRLPEAPARANRSRQFHTPGRVRQCSFCRLGHSGRHGGAVLRRRPRVASAT